MYVNAAAFRNELTEFSMMLNSFNNSVSCFFFSSSSSCVSSEIKQAMCIFQKGKHTAHVEIVCYKATWVYISHNFCMYTHIYIYILCLDTAIDNIFLSMRWCWWWWKIHCCTQKEGKARRRHTKYVLHIGFVEALLHPLLILLCIIFIRDRL